MTPTTMAERRAGTLEVLKATDSAEVRRFVTKLIKGADKLPADARPGLERMAKVDPIGALEQFWTTIDAGARASAPRRPRDPDAIVARACSEGRFSAERAPFWRSEPDRDPVGTTRLLQNDPSDGGLAPCAIAASGPPALTQAEEDAAHVAYMRNSHRNAARALGYGGSSRYAVEAREGRVNRINDRG